ncbi:MAG: hypothetical protein AB8G05_07510 [Oligoflexales bacterium]
MLLDLSHLTNTGLICSDASFSYEQFKYLAQQDGISLKIPVIDNDRKNFKKSEVIFHVISVLMLFTISLKLNLNELIDLVARLGQLVFQVI